MIGYAMSQATFRVPDFVGDDGVDYADIKVFVEMDGDIREVIYLDDKLQRPLADTKNAEWKFWTDRF